MSAHNSLVVGLWTVAITFGDLHADEAPLPVDENELARMVQGIIVANLPNTLEERDNWGKTAEVFDGFRFEGRGLRIKAEKRTKRVNHGLWKYYRVWFDDSRNDVQVRLHDLRTAGPNRVRFEMVVTAAMHGLADMQQWSNGLELLGISAQADMKVQLSLDCEVSVRLEASGFFFDLVVEPVVHQSRLELKDFQLKRVGTVLRGSLARELGDGLRSLVERSVRKQEARIREQANQAIAKSRAAGKLRFSPAEFVENFLGSRND